MRGAFIAGALLAALGSFANAQQAGMQKSDELSRWLDTEATRLTALYQHLHQHPELSFHERDTAARMAKELRELGLEVTEGVGGTGVVAVLRCGDGPVGLLRADMDALPIAEETGLPYASVVRAESADGRAIGVMHACGHDLHMTCLLGAAAWFARHRETLRGTLVFQLQPAEERSGGMNRMIADGLLTRFPRPQWALSLHTAHNLAVGQIGICAGPAMANVDSCDITMFGKGGHGAAPHLTIDPIVQGAHLVMDLQTIVSREIDPTQAAVITVGSIQGGNKHNIVPDQCHLQLTVRSYTDVVRKRMLEAIERKAKAVAASAGAPMPKIEWSEFTPVLRNDVALAKDLHTAFAEAFGADNVKDYPPSMTAEDFGRLEGEQIPLVQFRLGTVAADRLRELEARGELPPLHSAKYWPDAVPALRAGVRAFVVAVAAAGAR
ncbi:MAG: amidohydrolase [Planctomycetes bacterium]|nr:amidohydrolase [Planctomycetota bacterium]